MSKLVTTLPHRAELDKALAACTELGIWFDVIRPDPAYAKVGAPCLVLQAEGRMALAEHGKDDFVCSGWVDHRDGEPAIPAEEPPEFAEDVFGAAAVMVLAPCVADLTRIRATAHISGDLAQVFPYLNAEMREGCYTPSGPTFTFLDRYRMVCLHPRRIAIAKADDVVDAWRVLETIRRRVNDVWARRRSITPSHEQRERPPALEIFKRLPGTNCKECGELTCMAFAARLWQGQTTAERCVPVFGGAHAHLKEALLEICRGVGVAEEG
jgi:ArsR family metal-binding transcriptional regulator